MSKRVLIVDDEPLSVGGPRLELEARGFSVDVATTVAQARELLAAGVYDAVLLDLMLPLEKLGEPKTDPPLAEHGLELLRCIREGCFGKGTGTGPNTHVSVITALGVEAQDVLDICRTRYNPNNVFLKPLRSVLIAETMRIALEEHDA